MIKTFRSESLSAADFDPAFWIETQIPGDATINSIATTQHTEPTGEKYWITTINYDEPVPTAILSVRIDFKYKLNGANPLDVYSVLSKLVPDEFIGCAIGVLEGNTGAKIIDKDVVVTMISEEDTIITPF